MLISASSKCSPLGLEAFGTPGIGTVGQGKSTR